MPNIVIMSELKLWSMAKGKGAPSFFNTVKGYCDAGWNVVLINGDSDFDIEHYDLSLFAHAQISLLFPNAYNYKKIGYFGKIINQENIFRQFCSIVINIIKKNQWKKEETVLYAYEVASVRAASCLSKRLGTLFVSRFQGTIITPNKLSFGFVNRLRMYPHTYALSQKADVVIMTNDGTFGYDVLKSANNKSEKICFWRNGVNIPDSLLSNPDFEDGQIRANDKLLMTVSRLTYWKRIDRSIIAFSEVVKKKPECKLLIIGEGDARKDLEELVSQLGIEDSVIFTGSIPQNKVYQYMKRANVFLSLYDLSNLGNPLMEAMICGLPIITLKNGDTDSVIKHNENGVLLELDRLDEIPTYINKILDDQEYARHLSENAKLFAKKEFWSWDQRIKTEIDVISELLTPRIDVFI